MASSSVLIESVPGDVHAWVVQAELQKRGHQVCLFLRQELSEARSASLGFGAQQSAVVRGYGERVDLGDVRVVWHRRRRAPRAIREVVADDIDFVSRELDALCLAIDAAPTSAFLINEPFAARRADVKTVQLAMAQRVGLDVPDTLVSNEPEDIRAFLDRYADVIYKPLKPYVWKEGGRRFATYTARVSPRDLPSDGLIRTCPGIYQRRVPKQYEVRAQFFGDTCLAARIDSSRLPLGELDWRYQQSADACAGRIELPAEVFAGCRRLMRELGIVSGGFDFIVTPEDQWNFLEVNEAGQFLFLERWCPDIPMLDAFCGFLEAADPEYRYQERAGGCAYSNYCRSQELDAWLAKDRGGAVARHEASSRARAPALPVRVTPG